MHNGNCVKNEPKTITITCNATVDTRQSSNWCTSSIWTETTYTASDNLPFTVYIAQNLYEKWIASRNGCDVIYQQEVPYVANHIINAGNRVSTWRWAKFNSSVSWDNEVWYDGKVSYGVSTISKSSDLSAGFVEITSPVTTITDTVNGQEYVINLVDCAGWGDSPSPVYAKCWLAQSWTYTTSPNASLLCKEWEYSIPENVDGKWTWTCTNGNSVAECRANVSSSETLQCGTQKWTCIGWDVANKQGSKWNCVNGTESICCSYSCPGKTYSCPSGYRLTSDHKCELYMQFCVNDICWTSSLNAHLCTNGDTSNCGSETCFWDASQAADWAYCDWGRGTIEYSYDMTSQYDNYNINSTYVWWGMDPWGNQVWWYAIRRYNSKAVEGKCIDKNYYTTEQILQMCPTLKPVWKYNWKYDNGFYIDSETCTAVPEFDACEESWGECTVKKVGNALCDGGLVIDDPVVCTDACGQCYDTFGECKRNKPDSATSDCVLWTPSSALESQCYCYRPAATVPVCWAS